MASDTILIELGKLSNLAKDCSDALLSTDKTSEEKLELVSSKITELNFALQVGGYCTVSIFRQESIHAQLLGAKFRVIGAATLSVSSAQLIKSTAN